MSKLFNVTIISKSLEKLEYKALLLNIKTPNGKIGIMANRDPLVSILNPSIIEIVQDTKRIKIKIDDGFISFNNDATILVSNYEKLSGNEND